MKGGEDGFSSLELLIAVGIALLMMMGAATVGRKFLLEAVVERETACLVSDLRWAQQHNRTASYHCAHFSSARPSSVDDYRVRVRSSGYEVSGYGFNGFRGWEHVCPTSVFLSPPVRTGTVFFQEGGDARNPMTIMVYSALGRASASRYVIIDAAGRIRVDRRPP